MTAKWIRAVTILTLVAATTCKADYSEPLDERYTQTNEFRGLFEELQAALSNNDREKFASLFHYPVRIFVPAEEEDLRAVKAIRLVDTIKTSEEFIQKIDLLFSDENLAVMESLDFEDTQTIWYGVYIPGGGVLLGNYCIASGECEPTRPPAISVLYSGPPRQNGSN